MNRYKRVGLNIIRKKDLGEIEIGYSTDLRDDVYNELWVQIDERSLSIFRKKLLEFLKGDRNIKFNGSNDVISISYAGSDIESFINIHCHHQNKKGEKVSVGVFIPEEEAQELIRELDKIQAEIS